MEYRPGDSAIDVKQTKSPSAKKISRNCLHSSENFVIFVLERDTIPCTRIRKDTENRLKNRSYGSVS